MIKAGGCDGRKITNGTKRIAEGETNGDGSGKKDDAERSRVAANDYVARFETRRFQILNTNKERPRAKDRVVMYKKLDGEIKILRKNKPLKIREIMVEEVENPVPLTA